MCKRAIFENYILLLPCAVVLHLLFSGLIHAKLSGIVMSDHDSNKTCVDSNWHWETRTSAFNLVSMDGAIVEVLPQKQMNSKVAPKGPLQMYSKVAHCFLHLLVFIHSYE